jgi:hypothetical protein|tara:strand:+ start:614 stop:784 length:171 start_codon:yes stop_codon:yes gene_type:complete
MRFQKLKWEEMTIEEKVSNLKNRIWKFFQKYPHIKEIKDERIYTYEYTKLPEMQGY